MVEAWSKIVGLLLAAGGLPALISPDRLQQRLRRKGMRYVTRWLFLCLVFIGSLLISFAWQQEGWIPKAVGVAGFVMLLKALLLLRTRIGQLIAERLVDLQPIYLRLIALCQVAAGIGLYLLSKSDS